MTRNTLVIGAGFLGKAVVSHLKRLGETPKHTYRQHQFFSESIQLDLRCHNVADIVPLPEIDVLIFTTKVEGMADSEAMQVMMHRVFQQCRDKRVVYLSTDAVFDGRKGMYVESDSPNPVTEYGRNKKTCEDLLAALVPDHCIVRTSYIYGFSGGQLDARLSHARQVLREGSGLRKFVDMYKSPIEVNRLACIVASAGRSPYRGILHAGGIRQSVFDFFQRSLSALGEDTRFLLPEYIPDNAPADCLVDTSLDSSLLERTLGIAPAPAEFLPTSRGKFGDSGGSSHQA